MSRRAVLVGAAAIVVVLIGVGAWLIWPRGSSPVTMDEARDDLDDPVGETGPTEPSTGLADGIYVFAAEGTQSVGFGALTDEDRTIPETVNVGIRSEGDGCFQVNLNLLDQHVERTWFCRADDVLTVERHRKEMEVGALSPTIDMTCDPNIAADTGSEPTRHSLDCAMDVSVAVVETTGEAAGTATVSPVEDVDVGGVTRSAIPVELVYTMDGGMSGFWSEHYWFDTETMLPLRIERSMDLSGPASISETSTLALTDLEPAP